MRLAIAIGVALVCAACIIGCKKTDNSTDIPIGEYGSLSGDTATFGISTHEGALLAVEEINNAGGVLGKKIKLITEDDQSKPDQAVAAVQKLLTQNNVVAVLGEVASSRSIVAAPFCQRAGVPMLSPASTNPKVTQVGDYIFRACFTDPFQGTVMANFAMLDPKGPKAKRIAVLYDVKNDYSVGLRDYFVAAVKKNGGEIVDEKSYGAGDTDFAAQLSSIKAANPETIFVPGYYGEVGLICKQAKGMGITVPLLGGDGWDSEKLMQIGGDAVNGNYFSNHASPDDDRPEMKTFVAAYRARFAGKTPDSMAVLGYDSIKLLADAITRAGSATPKAIRDALATTKNFPGVGGNINIDANRNAEKPIVVLKIVDGKYAFVSNVKP